MSIAGSEINNSSQGGSVSEDGKKKSNRNRGGKKQQQSNALKAAMQSVKEFMTDSQKGHTLLKEGKLCADQGDHNGAIEIFCEGINFNPTIVPLYTMRAASYKAINKWAEAYFDYSYAIRLEPENSVHYCFRGLVSSKLKRLQLAMEDLNYACKLDSSALQFFSRATVHAEFGKYDLAVNGFTRALADENITVDLKTRCLHRRALAYFDAELYDDAVYDLQNILMNDPNNLMSRCLLGRTLKMMALLKDAEEQLDLVIEQDANTPTYYLERGDIRFRAQHKDKIIESIYDFDKAVKLYEEKLRPYIPEKKSSRVVSSLRKATSLATTIEEDDKESKRGDDEGNASVSTKQRSEGGREGGRDGGKEYKNDEEEEGEAVGEGEGLEGSSIGEGEGDGDHELGSVDGSQGKAEGEGEGIGEGEGEGGGDGDDDADDMMEAGSVGSKLEIASEMSEASSINGSVRGGGKAGGGGGGGGRGGDDGHHDGDNSVNGGGHGKSSTHRKQRHKKGQSDSDKHGFTSRPIKNDPVAQAIRKELEEKMSEVLFFRAKAKLLLDPSPLLLQGATEDALRAVASIPGDDDYQIVLAVCYIRRGKFVQAMDVLKIVLDRSPYNEKALFHFAFCQRSQGHQKDAIEGLTKIIVNAEYMQGVGGGGGSDSTNPSSSQKTALSIPLGRVFETRGTLFHEIQAHKLALKDLARAVVLDVEKAENYYLRGDCHAKMGNYELALADLNLAEEKKFSDMCSLCTSRGIIYRLLNKSAEATKDFTRALGCLSKDNVNGRVRISTLKALSLIDQRLYQPAHDLLVEVIGIIQDMMHAEAKKSEEKEEEEAKATLALESSMHHHHHNHNHHHNNHHHHHQQQQQQGKNKDHKMESETMISLKKTEWILLYHTGLSLYMQKKFDSALSALEKCTDLQVRKYVVDSFALGTVYFFAGVSLSKIDRFEEAESYLTQAMQTKWGALKKNKMLATFAIARVLQSLSKYKESLDMYSKAIEADSQCAHAYFRRAWLYKAMGDNYAAVSDFETAKNLRLGDPNFSVDYKRIRHVEYMQLESEPDISEPFLPLLPQPGSGLLG